MFLFFSNCFKVSSSFWPGDGDGDGVTVTNGDAVSVISFGFAVASLSTIWCFRAASGVAVTADPLRKLRKEDNRRGCAACFLLPLRFFAATFAVNLPFGSFWCSSGNPPVVDVGRRCRDV